MPILRFRDGGLAACPCGRRTTGRCEDCGRAACEECARVETVAQGLRKVRSRLCPRCWFRCDSEDRLVPPYPEVWAAIARRIEAAGACVDPEEVDHHATN